MNHGVGFEKALANTKEMSEQWVENLTAMYPDEVLEFKRKFKEIAL